MSGFDLPTREGWCVEGYFKGKKHPMSRYYLTSNIKTKEAAKKQFLEDTYCSETEFDKIDVLECMM